jgi:hypothetical protein
MWSNNSILLSPQLAKRIDAAGLHTVDVHVHLEHSGDQSETARQAGAYFKRSASPDPVALAECRSRHMACVVFTVDETRSGMPRLSNDAVMEFAATHADIAIPFASIPLCGAEAV